MSKMTPMMLQYQEIKQQYREYILFFRLGDFYEMFFEDAVTASEVLDITLTKRQAGGGKYAPLCGVPYHSADAYLAKLIASGYKVAICEQVEDPKVAKGIVKREVVRLVTAGTLTDPQLLNEKENHYLAALYQENQQIAVAYTDLTTGLLSGRSFTKESGAALRDYIANLAPKEILIDSALAGSTLMANITQLDMVVTQRSRKFFSAASAADTIARTYGKVRYQQLEKEADQTLISSLGALLSYLYETQKMALNHFTRLALDSADKTMVIDQFTRLNLEIIRTMRSNETRGSLLWVLDKVKTAMGGRLLRQWLENPLIDQSDITTRSDVVNYFFDARVVRDDVRRHLSDVYDFERLLGKAVFGSINPRDMQALKSSLAVLPPIKSLLRQATSPAVRTLGEQIDCHQALYDELCVALDDDVPFSTREGAIFKDGYHAALDALRDVSRNSKRWLLKIEAQERQKTGIKTLKIGYNKVFGYYVDVSKSQIDKVPEYYHRKQTLSNSERYILPELKTIEDKILGAEEKIKTLEYELFGDLRQAVIAQISQLQTTSALLAKLDCLTNFAHVSALNNYVRPSFNENARLKIVGGRHPVVEQIVDQASFVPNDSLLDDDQQMITIITGPNMAGKSTYLRQIALIVLMAQIGCYVPAAEADLSVVDRIFTRVGASDDLFHGYSTFMVEMNELANILNKATANSLIILDEIGRGTSTFDGLSIAWAVIEHIAETLRAKTVFATHYHELTELEGLLSGVVNYRMTVSQQGEAMTFLRRVERGGANRSFGIAVAKMAGVPRVVLQRARQLLQSLERHDIAKINQLSDKAEQSTAVESLTQKQRALLQELSALDIDTMTPLQALNELQILSKRAGEYRDD